MLRRKTGSYEVGSIEDSLTLPSRKPDLVISAGHSTHPFLLRLARRFRCPSTVIMKPSLPSFLFSHCLIPEHDLKLGKKVRKNIITTKGALNRIPEEIPTKKNKGLMMLGGPSKHFDWQSDPIIKAIPSIIAANPDLEWTIGDSRRTPPDTLSQISNLNLPITLAPHLESTGLLAHRTTVRITSGMDHSRLHLDAFRSPHCWLSPRNITSCIQRNAPRTRPRSLSS